MPLENLRATWVPLLVFAVIAIGLPVLVGYDDYRRGSPVRPRVLIGYLVLGIALGGALAGQLVMPPEVRTYFHFPPPGIR